MIPQRFFQSSFSRTSLIRTGFIATVLTILGAIIAIGAFAQAPSDAPPLDLSELEERAMQAAVARVAPSVVRIETVGGAERVGRVVFGDGPTTGLIVSEDGLVISSAFNFANKPGSILIVLPDGTRTAAKIVATDHNRNLTLLKIKTDLKLLVPEAVANSQMRVGAWSIAVGRTFGGSEVNLSVGIISALDRIWDKALQTDAKISPANYGGPLVDIRGRVLGVLVPLSPQAGGEVAGVEWYDSGIGFAVPLEHINRVLEKLKSGTDLYPGLMGISFKSPDLYSKPPTIGGVRTKSPAAAAGLKAGDRIIEINGHKIERLAQVKHKILSRYAGETVRLVVLRGKQSLARELVLAKELAPYEHPFLGILPKRIAATTEDKPGSGPGGVVVRYVFPGSGADRAGIRAGDTIVSLGESPTSARDEAIAQMAQWQPGDEIKLTYRRGEESTDVTVTLDELPRSIPAVLPVAVGAEPAKSDTSKAGTQETETQETGTVGDKQPIKIAEFKNQCFAYLPASYSAGVAQGVVVWPQTLASRSDERSIALWRETCERDHLILLVPKSAERTKWERSETVFIRKTLDHVMQKYHVDRTRIVAFGRGVEAAVAYRTAFANRDRFRAVVAVEGPLPMLAEVPEVDPAARLAIFSAMSKTSKQQRAIRSGVARLEKEKVPVTVLETVGRQRVLSKSEIGDLARWIDSLDRI